MRCVLTALLLGLAACAGPSARFEPAPRAHRVGEDVAVTEVEDVYVETEVNAWPGEGVVPDRFTAIRVRLQNRSDREIRVEYPGFALVGPRGRRYAARAPRDLAPPEPEQPGSALYPDFTAPPFEAYFDDLHPDLETGRTHPLGWSIDPHETFQRVWLRGVPTERMEALRLREGPLGPGEDREGLLYFERVPPDGGTFEFRFDVVEDESGARAGSAVIPLRRRG